MHFGVVDHSRLFVRTNDPILLVGHSCLSDGRRCRHIRIQVLVVGFIVGG